MTLKVSCKGESGSMSHQRILKVPLAKSSFFSFEFRECTAGMCVCVCVFATTAGSALLFLTL